MSSYLAYTATIDSDNSVSYWWPILLDVAGHEGFGFANPYYLPEIAGIYYSASDAFEKATFRDFWDAVVVRHDAVNVELWSRTEADFCLWITVRHDRPGSSEISVSLPIESLPEGTSVELDHKETLHRLNTWLNIVFRVHTSCQCSSAILAWVRWGSEYEVGRIAAANSQVEIGPNSPTGSAWKQEQFTMVRKALGSQWAATLLNPMPIPWRGDWTFVALSE